MARTREAIEEEKISLPNNNLSDHLSDYGVLFYWGDTPTTIATAANFCVDALFVQVTPEDHKDSSKIFSTNPIATHPTKNPIAS